MLRVLFHILLLATPAFAGAQSLQLAARDWAFAYAVDNPTTGPVFCQFSRSVLDPGTGEQASAFIVPADSATTGMLFAAPGPIELTATSWQGSATVEALVLSDLNRPLSPEMRAVILALEVTPYQVLMDQVEANFARVEQIPQPVRRLAGGILMQAMDAHWKASGENPEAFVRRALHDIRNARADVLGPRSPEIELEIRAAFMQALYLTSLHRNEDLAAELTVLSSQLDNSGLPAEFLSTFSISVANE